MNHSTAHLLTCPPPSSAQAFLCSALVFCALVQVAFWRFHSPSQVSTPPGPPQSWESCHLPVTRREGGEGVPLWGHCLPGGGVGAQDARPIWG